VITTISAALLAGLASPTAADTVWTLEARERLVLRIPTGSVLVEEGPADQVRVEGAQVVVRRDGRVVEVELGRRGGGAGRDAAPAEAVVHVPTWAEVRVLGRSLDVTATGREGTLDVQTLSGDVRLTSTRGHVRVSTLGGDIVAEGASGGLTLSSHGGDVLVTDARGAVAVRSLSGDLVLERSRAREVRADAQAGDVRFSGEIAEDGRYAFLSHAGDVILELRDPVDAEVSVSTFHGDFRSDFPVVASGFSSGRPFAFELGTGAARIRIETFSGEVRLVRPE